MCHKTMMGTCIIKENLIGQSGTILVGKVASNRRVEKSKCKRLRHMEREGIKGGEKEKNTENLRKEKKRKRREERKKRERREKRGRRERTLV